MIYLLFSILFNGLIFLIFRLLKSRDVDVLPTLIINYVVAGLFGFALHPDQVLGGTPPQIGLAVAFGALFIVVFFLMARSSIQYGMGFSSVLTKLSMIIPVVGAVLLLDDHFSTNGFLGFCIAIPAIFLLIKIEKREREFSWIPLLLFLGSGTIDLGLKWTDIHVLTHWSVEGFIPIVFSAAALLGLVFLKKPTSKRYLFWGVVLGLVNYGSMWFMLKAMAGLSASIFFPFQNLGIITFSTLLGLFLFKESFTRKQQIGLLLSCIAIGLMSW